VPLVSPFNYPPNPAGGIGPAPVLEPASIYGPPISPDTIRYVISSHGGPIGETRFKVPRNFTIAFFTKHTEKLLCGRVAQTAACAATQDDKIKESYKQNEYCYDYILEPDTHPYGHKDFFHTGAVHCIPGKGNNKVVFKITKNIKLSELINTIHDYHIINNGDRPALVYGLFCRGGVTAPVLKTGWLKKK
jgi:hypothetical protein